MSQEQLINRIISLEKRVTALEVAENHRRESFGVHHTVVQKDSEDADIISHLDDIGTQKAVILTFYPDFELTKVEVQNKLTVWGQTYGSWFTGGNFNNRLLKKGIIRAVGRSDGTDPKYALTGKGRNLAEDYISELRSKHGTRD